MDGISGASGVFAVVSIAIQLGEGAYKLVQLYSDVRDAPKYIEDLLGQLETLSDVIKETKSSVPENYWKGASAKALEDCERKISELYHKKLKAQAGLRSQSNSRRKLSALKAALSKKETQALQENIDRASDTLKQVQFNFFLQVNLAPS